MWNLELGPAPKPTMVLVTCCSMFKNIISESHQVVLSHAKATAKDYWETKMWLSSAQLPLQTLGQGFNIVSELSDHFWGRTLPSPKTHESWWNDLPTWKPSSCKRCWLPRYFLVGSRLQSSEKPNCLKKNCWMAGFWRQSKSNPSIHSKWEGCVAKLVYVGVFGHWKVAKRCHLQAQTSSEHLPEEPQLLHAQPAVRARMPWAPLSAAGHAQVLRLRGADWLVLDPGTLLGRNGVKSQLGRSSGYCLLQPELFPARHCTYRITTEGNSVIVHSSTHRAACARHLRDFCS